ncbi:MAG: cytochrome P450 [Actinomycetota bacterium]|nr:cytochrome P450 [Actinomycetota bacterium]
MSASLEELTVDPHAVLARLRATAPVAWVSALGGFLVTRRDLVVEVLRDDVAFTVDDPRFSTARVVGHSMLSRDGEEHARHRAAFAGAWRKASIRATFAGWVRGEADRLVAQVRPAGSAELREALAGPLAAAAMRRALGLEHLAVADVLGWYRDIVAAVSALSAGRALPASGTSAYAALRDAVADTVATQAPTLTREEASSNAAILLFGGIETTEGMIATLLLHLLADQGTLRSVREDRALLSAAVEESLRLEPAAAVVDRYATSGVDLAGVHIPQGALVVVSLAAANRDPAAFEDPDRFDLHRPTGRSNLAFATGPHVCLGMHLARLEALAAAEAVLDGLPDLALDHDASTPPSGLVFRKPARVVARWQRSEFLAG